MADAHFINYKNGSVADYLERLEKNGGGSGSGGSYDDTEIRNLIAGLTTQIQTLQTSLNGHIDKVPNSSSLGHIKQARNATSTNPIYTSTDGNLNIATFNGATKGAVPVAPSTITKKDKAYLDANGVWRKLEDEHQIVGWTKCTADASVINFDDYSEYSRFTVLLYHNTVRDVCKFELTVPEVNKYLQKATTNWFHIVKPFAPHTANAIDCAYVKQFIRRTAASNVNHIGTLEIKYEYYDNSTTKGDITTFDYCIFAT